MKLRRKTLVGRLGEDAVAHADVKAAGALYGFARCVIDLEPTESVVGLVLLKAPASAHIAQGAEGDWRSNGQILRGDLAA